MSDPCCLCLRLCSSAAVTQVEGQRNALLQLERKEVFEKRNCHTRLASLPVKERRFQWLLMLCCNPHSERHANVGI